MCETVPCFSAFCLQCLSKYQDIFRVGILYCIPCTDVYSTETLIKIGIENEKWLLLDTDAFPLRIFSDGVCFTIATSILSLNSTAILCFFVCLFALLESLLWFYCCRAVVVLRQGHFSFSYWPAHGELEICKELGGGRTSWPHMVSCKTITLEALGRGIELFFFF